VACPTFKALNAAFILAILVEMLRTAHLTKGHKRTFFIAEAI
jgi:hypothetical protein